MKTFMLIDFAQSWVFKITSWGSGRNSGETASKGGDPPSNMDQVRICPGPSQLLTYQNKGRFYVEMLRFPGCQKLVTLLVGIEISFLGC